MNANIAHSIDKASAGGELTVSELRELFAVHYLSEEAFLIQQASRKMSQAAARGKAEVHGQVGIDVGLCAKNCDFCSFATKNGIFREHKVHPLGEIIDKCLSLEAEGANAIYLMATATVEFAEYITIAKEARAALNPGTPLVANIDDFDERQAGILRKTGFTGIYHCVRIGEGVVTAIDPALRLRTIAAAKKAGLLLGTTVGPVGPEHSIDQLVDTTILSRSLQPVSSGSCRRINISGLPLAAHGMVNYSQMGHILAVVRLANGYQVIGHGTHEPNGIGAMAGANLFWAEQGANPRDTSEHTVRGWTVSRTREVLDEAGWEILQGPSAIFTIK